MNPLRKHVSTRTKQDIKSIRHVYLDLDHGGQEALNSIENSSAVPKPNYVLTSSPGKFQIVWKGRRNGDFGEVLQRVTTAKKASSPEFQAWLRYKNAIGSDIYIGMNPLRKRVSTRTIGPRRRRQGRGDPYYSFIKFAS
jgi:hypothetical protein